MSGDSGNVVWAFSGIRHAPSAAAPQQLNLFWGGDISRGRLLFFDIQNFSQATFLNSLAVYGVRSLLDIRVINSFDFADFRPSDLAIYFRNFNIHYSHYERSVPNKVLGEGIYGHRHPNVMLSKQWFEYLSHGIKIGSVGVLHDQSNIAAGEVAAIRGAMSCLPEYRGEILANTIR